MPPLPPPRSQDVQAMFEQIAASYDFLNDFLSLGIHRYWKRAVVRKARVRAGMRVLDCASGTGDLAFLFRRAVGDGQVTGVDFCAPMVKLAQGKAAIRGADVRFREGDVLRLTDADHAYDAASIAFGIRNVTDPVGCLREMARVVKPGRPVLVLEFGQPGGWMRWPYWFYSFAILPFWGWLFSGSRSAYVYLPRTASLFPCGDEFLALMDQAGVFSSMSCQPLTGGIAYLYRGIVR